MTFYGAQRCDFCHPAKRARWDYPADSFKYVRNGHLPFHSEGGWLACEQCAQLIEDNDREGLARANTAHLDVLPMPWRLGLIDRFFAFRRGDRLPFG